MSIDVAIAGGGPAGMCAALACAQRGLSVQIYEPRSGPLDKACGEGIMPAGVRILEELGVQLEGMPFHGIRYVQGTHIAEGRFARSPGLGVRRIHLAQRLREACLAAGVRFVDKGLRDIPDPHRATLDLPAGKARHLVIADGLQSPLRKKMGLERRSRWPARMGLRRHYRTQPWTDHVEVHWSDIGEAYVTPIATDEVGVAVLLRRTALPDGPNQQRFDDLLVKFPAILERLGEPVSSVRGAGPFAVSSSTRVKGRCLLVGDAAGYLDPLTGEGIRMAAECAPALAHAVYTGDLDSYERAYKRITRPYYRWTGMLLALALGRWTRRAIVPVASAVPALMHTTVQALGE